MHRLLAVLLLAPLPALADAPEVVAVEAARTGTEWRFAVTVRHADAGWDHYADAWAVLDADGTEIARRTLLHPHVDEQPFTRSLGGVALPEGTRSVHVRAHDTVHGWGEAVEVALP
ncbi:hypothetical protein [Jannaschia sp. W003]|uniref:hypothetical protein n=1 Tax=Jannaschia sp. W003 TaxID=2867012 RepID=UPI0021A8EB65|nr:hypothetical protein [Jannaschia sp. W003]UWQ22581.1 hypothetical protein K3554_06025 [Jannaschia sp. W003]